MSRVVLVTGGTSGLGKAVAARFRAADDAVVITGRRRDQLRNTAAELDVRPIQCDAADPDDVARMSDELGDNLDVLVNMAGGNTDFGREDPEDTSLKHVAEAWYANFASNVVSAVLTTSAVLDKLRHGGSIINVSSIGAEYAGSSYGASKAAVAAWTAGLSADVGPKGLTANTISPGYTAETNFFRGRLTTQRETELIAATQDGRAGRPDDIADAAYFLASPQARHITGQTLHVNGGAHTTR